MYGQGKTRGQSAVLEITATTNQACFAIYPNEAFLPEYLQFWFRHSYSALRESSEGRGGNQSNLNGEILGALEVPWIEPTQQEQVIKRLKTQLAEVEVARLAVQLQLREVTKLEDSIIYDSIKKAVHTPRTLGDVLDEVKRGIGQGWKSYPVLGATREGLAPAKEQPGKQAPKYKPAFPGTVFYNPMRILIGSIAFVDDDDKPGITSPDYVALQGKEGVVDSRWFYHWLRSPLGVQCILSLARGAVRERMLFNRLAEGSIELPNFTEQEKASAA
jgi:type I restriction enzyme S subunit